MDRRLLPMLLLACLPLAACDRAPAPGGDAAPAAEASAPAPAPDPTPVPGDIAGALPADFIVSTNEPFWQARVEGDAVVLSGPEVEGRRFTIDTRDDGEGQRLVRASDASGSISVTLAPGPCEDSMSGAAFPQSGALTIDGVGPVQGCARPADMPPPGEPGR